MTPWFAALERFNPSVGAAWDKYIAWSGLTQLDELRSLDFMLCPSVLKDVRGEYWDYMADYRMFGFFTDLDFLKAQLNGASNYSLVCTVLNPEGRPRLPDALRAFEFCGFDLLEVGGTTSALTNCGGFPLAFDNSELSAKGLIEDYARAEGIRRELRLEYPQEPTLNAICGQCLSLSNDHSRRIADIRRLPLGSGFIASRCPGMTKKAPLR